MIRWASPTRKIEHDVEVLDRIAGGSDQPSQHRNEQSPHRPPPSAFEQDGDHFRPKMSVVQKYFSTALPWSAGGQQAHVL
jgi:hypothetical protein